MQLLKEIYMPFPMAGPPTPEQQAHALAVQARHNALCALEIMESWSP